jgi:hypothetical protein
MDFPVQSGQKKAPPCERCWESIYVDAIIMKGISFVSSNPRGALQPAE